MLDLYDRVTRESAEVLASFGDRKEEDAALERFEKSGAKLGKRAGEIATDLGATCLAD
jgi:trimethylamine:corrinoid methyltransferase-like protein